jgi:hypothetical protein
VGNPLFFRLWAAQTRPPISFPSWEGRAVVQGRKTTEMNTFQNRRKEVSNMAVFRIEKTRDYTVMSNHHLRDKSLSLKAKGLLSLMLSLPEEWD